MHFTFMLLCIVTDFYFNNQPDALIIQIYSVIILSMFRASYQCRMYSRKFLMVGREDARNMQSFITE